MGTIAGEGTLYYVLAGAVLADLALANHVRTEPGWGGTTRVLALQESPPTDDILRAAWDYVSEKPRNIQTVLAAVGPPLRSQVLDRIVDRGDVRREPRKALGFIKVDVLVAGDGERRARLLAQVREVLVDGVEPEPRVAALAALISGSGTLPQFDPDIPWTTPVITRAKELERGNWGAGAAAEAVTRTMMAIVVNSAVVAATVAPKT